MNTKHGSSMQPLSTQEILDAELNRFKLSNAIKNRFIAEKEKQVHIDSNKINNKSITSSPNPKEIRDAHVQRFKLSNEIKKHYRRSSINNDSTGESASPESIETKGCSNNNIVNDISRRRTIMMILAMMLRQMTQLLLLVVVRRII